MNGTGDGVMFSSTEEGEHSGGHEDHYKDVMMEKRPPLTSPDGSSNTPERCPRPLDSTQEEGSGCQQENLSVVMVEPHFKGEGQGEAGGNALQKLPESHHSKEGCTEDAEVTENEEGGLPKGLNVIVISDSEEEEEVATIEVEIPDILPDDLPKKTPQNLRTAVAPKPKDLLTVWKLDDVSGPKILTMSHQTLMGDKPYSCHECGGSFKYKSSLNLHQRIHSGEKPYSCSECGKQFIQKVNYQRHHRLHFGEKQYKCTECAQNQNLVVQQRFRSESEHYPCSECGANFIQQSHLTDHKKTHKDLRCFPCPDCGDVFMLRSSLVNHQKVHSAEKHYSS